MNLDYEEYVDEEVQAMVDDAVRSNADALLFYEALRGDPITKPYPVMGEDYQAEDELVGELNFEEE